MTLSGLLVWCIVGLIAGAIARLLVPGRDPMGCLGTMALGLAGSLVGGTLASLIAGRGFEMSGAGIIGSIVGAILVLLLIRYMTRSRTF